jgi:DNA-binding response OmpR family regulator
MHTRAKRSVVLVEDDEITAGFLSDNLTADGFDVTTARGARDGWRVLELKTADLLLLDLSLGDGNGLVLLDRLRAADGVASRVDPALPVIVVSGRGSELDRVRGFQRGADDYLAKPFSYPELLHRIRAVLRRSDLRSARGTLRVGELTIDPLARAVSLAGEPVQLSAKEFGLLYALASDPGRVFSKDELLRDVWGYASAGSTRTLDTHACRLRAKLSCGDGRFVITVRGVGYKLVDAL